MFRDEDFAALYCQDHGRSSVPPSLLPTALLLQAHDWVSDAEAHRRATGGRELAQEPLVLAADPRPEQLCWMSSFQQGEMVFDPWFLGFDHGIEIGEKSANGRDEGDLLRFAQRTQVPVKLADHRVVPSEGYYLGNL